MRSERTPVTVAVGDVLTIKTHQLAHSDLATIPLPALLKLLDSGKVVVECAFSYTDDYAYDNATNFGRGQVDPAPLAASYRAWRPRSGRCHYTRGAIHFGRHSNECFRLRPIEGRVTVTPR